MGHDAERELRQDFEDWFRSAAARDLDAVMIRIAEDVISYEHEAPLQYRGRDAVREVCRQGFEVMKGEFRWDIPDLEVLVSGDLAVTWGLNRMRAQEPRRDEIELFSRGTRVFRRIGGAWKMVHQHVSFPYDPQTGRAELRLRPESQPAETTRA